MYRNLITQKKNQYCKRKAASLAASIKNSSDFWKQVRACCGERKPELSEKTERQGWFDHFQQLFTQADGGISKECSELDDEVTEILDLDSDVLNQLISETEVRASLSLKTGKACGLDNILAEMLKLGGSKISMFLVTYFNNLFDKDIYPQDWAKTIIVPIHKKGNADLPDNYRGVSMLSIISECYTSILNKRLYAWLEDKIAEEQAGFRQNYSTVDHIFVLNAIVQKHLEKRGAKMYLAFVNFRKVFGSVRLCKLLETLQKEGVSGKLAGIIKAMYNSLLSCVRMNNEYTDFFECPNGIRQGCVLSSTLFCLFINQLAEHIQSAGKHGVQMLSGLIELFILLFADDVTLLTTTPSGLQNQLNCLRDRCVKMGMKVNEGKTNVMIFRNGGHLGKHEKW